MIRIIFLMFALVMVTAEAHAQLFLENGKETIAVSGGEHTNGTLLIHNTSAQPESIKVYWEDFEYTSPYDGSKNFLPAGTASASASQWVTFSPSVFTLSGFGQQKVDYTVAAPSQVKEGHYGVLFFESNSDVPMNDKGVNLITRVGCLFFIEPKDKSKKADVRNIGLKANSLTADFINQGNVILIPHTTYYIMRQEGLVLLRGDAGKRYVPVGALAPLEIPLKKPINPGHYTVVINSNLEEGDVVVKEIGLAVDASGQITLEKVQD